VDQLDILDTVGKSGEIQMWANCKYLLACGWRWPFGMLKGGVMCFTEEFVNGIWQCGSDSIPRDLHYLCVSFFCVVKVLTGVRRGRFFSARYEVHGWRSVETYPASSTAKPEALFSRVSRACTEGFNCDNNDWK
jgi:hypothetical protein